MHVCCARQLAAHHAEAVSQCAATDSCVGCAERDDVAKIPTTGDAGNSKYVSCAVVKYDFQATEKNQLTVKTDDQLLVVVRACVRACVRVCVSQKRSLESDCGAAWSVVLWCGVLCCGVVWCGVFE